MRARFADARWIAVLAIVAAGVRALVWWRTAALFNDGPVFIGLARLMEAGEWDAVVAHPYHPLYPLAIRVAHLAVEDWETAAAAVSVLSGVAAVVVLFLFLRDAFDRRIAAVGAALLAVHPYGAQFSADVQSDALYLAFFLAGVAALWRASLHASPAWAGIAGVAAALAYGVRPEGVVVWATGAAVGGLAVVSGRWRLGRGATWLGALSGCALLVMAPYLLALRAHTGHWVLTQKKSVTALGSLHAGGAPGHEQLDADVDAALLASHPFLETVVRGPRSAGVARVAGSPAMPAPAPARARAAVRELVLALISTLRPELALALVVAAVWLARRGAPGTRAAFLLGFASLYLAVLFALAFSVGYVSRRHALPPVVLLLGYAAIGVCLVGGWLAAALRLATGRPTPPPAWVAAALGVALMAAIAAPKTLQARRDDRLASRRAAEWLRGQPQRRGAVAAPKQRIAYYADAPFVPLGDAGSGALLEYLHSAGARYMIVDDEHPDAKLATSAGLRDSLTAVHRVEARGRSATVYAIEQAD